MTQSVISAITMDGYRIAIFAGMKLSPVWLIRVQRRELHNAPMRSPASSASPFSPVQIGPLKLRNRFIKSATNEGMAKGGVPSKLLVEHHRRIAAGGVAMTTVAYCAVSPDGRTFVDQVTLDDASIPHLRALTEAVHREGAAIA